MKVINNKLNKFESLKLIKSQSISDICDQNISIVNNLSNDLIKLRYLNDKLYDKLIPKIIHEYNTIISPKTIKTIKKINRISLKKGKNESILFKRKLNKINNIKSIKNKLFNNLTNKKITNSKIIKNYFNKNETSNLINKYKTIKNNDFHFSFNIENKYKIDLNKAFITEQKTENKNAKEKKRAYSYKNINIPHKISKKELTHFINTSSDLYTKQFNILKKNNEKNEHIKSGRQNFYKIKYLLQRFNMRGDIHKELEYYVNEDIDINKIYKTMRLFHNSFKNKITFNKNNTKAIMITKKNADIINYCDYFNHMDDLYFFKNNKSYNDNYPILSKKAREDPFNKDYNKIIYHSYKDIIEENARNIRKLLKKCMKSLNKNK